MDTKTFKEFFDKSLQFTVLFRKNSLTDLMAAIKSVGSYNNFSGRHVAKFIQELENDGFYFSAEFGRDYSPVLFLQTSEENFKKFNIEQRAKAKSVAANEIQTAYMGYEGEEARDVRVRIWWD